MTENKWVPELTDLAYHADYQRIGSSGMKIMFTQSPRHYKHYKDFGIEVTEAMEFGTKVHDILFHPHLRDNIKVAPKVDRRTTVGKNEYAKFEMSIKEDSIVLSDAEAEALLGMIKSIQEHPTAKVLFSDGIPECAGYFTDPRTGLQMKCKPDFRRHEGILVDLKTARSADPYDFKRQAEELGYLIQAAFYSRGYEAIEGKPPKAFIFVAVEKTPPFYEVSCHTVTDAQMELGQHQLDMCLDKLNECALTGNWPGRWERLMDLNISDYQWEKTI